MPHRHSWSRLALTATLVLTGTAYAQSDTTTYEATLERSSAICPGHSKDRTTPGVRAVKVDALRVLLKNDVILCPDRRLDAEMPVVWYGAVKVLAWNPEAKGSIAVLAEKADAMTRKEEFPGATLVWKTDGSEAKGVTVPSADVRPRTTIRVIP